MYFILAFVRCTILKPIKKFNYWLQKLKILRGILFMIVVNTD